MGYGIAPNFSHFTGKKKPGNPTKNRKRKMRTKKVHKNKYESNKGG